MNIRILAKVVSIDKVGVRLVEGVHRVREIILCIHGDPNGEMQYVVKRSDNGTMSLMMVKNRAHLGQCEKSVGLEGLSVATVHEHGARVKHTSHDTVMDSRLFHGVDRKLDTDGRDMTI